MRCIEMGFTLFLCSLMMATQAQEKVVRMDKPTTRAIPAWFNEAKFGIFVVWGPYSVPAFSNKGYAEWYWDERTRDSVTKAYNDRAYGPDFDYENFGDMFKPHLFNPDEWCDLFVRSGAKYVVTTANYHDGFAMWPTNYAQTSKTRDWNSMVRGPKMDIIGTLQKAGEAKGLKMGIYYSLYEWHNPLWKENRENFAIKWLQPKFKEVVSLYKPWFIFLDGDWSQGYKPWHSEELASWLYNESPVKDNVVVNDRWGDDARGIYGDVYESEYGGGKYTNAHHPWQEDRGIGHSYGYNRHENIDDYDTKETLIRRLSLVIGGGGNLLLDVGPTADGRIPVIMQERLLQIGDWLKVNGEAIYGTTANPFWPRLFEWGTMSQKPGKLYIHVSDPNVSELTIPDFAARVKKAVLLHADGNKAVSTKTSGHRLALKWNKNFNDPAVTIIALDIEGNPAGSKSPMQFSDGTLEFNCWAMKVHGTKAYPYYYGANNWLKIVNWTDPEEYVTADFIMNKPGKYELSLIYQANGKRGQSGAESKGNAGSEFIIEIEGKVIRSQTVNTDNRYSTIHIGTVEFKNSGLKKIKISPDKNGYWKDFNLQGVKIVPSKKK